MPSCSERPFGQTFLGTGSCVTNKNQRQATTKIRYKKFPFQATICIAKRKDGGHDQGIKIRKDLALFDGLTFKFPNDDSQRKREGGFDGHA